MALSLALASGAQAAKAVHVSCGQTITKDTKLANDLIDCPGVGIIIGADDIRLDLNGHTVDGDGIGDFEGIRDLAHRGVTVEHGTIREFVEGIAVVEGTGTRLRHLSLSDHRHVGIFIADASNVHVQKTTSVDIAFAAIFLTRSREIRVERNSAARNGTGIAAENSDDLHVTDNDIAGNEFEGIFLGGANHVTLEGNFVSRNGDNIIVADSSNNAVTGNSVVDALGFPDDPVGGFGILVDGGDDNLIEGNAIAGAASNGVRLVAFDPDGTGTAERNVLRDNSVKRTRLDGYLVDATATGSLLARNFAERAGDDGIHIDSPSTTATRNRANRNHDLGIEAVAGVTDGGGNKATGNGNPLQCTNVFCK